jgi:hypothetical protein
MSGRECYQFCDVEAGGERYCGQMCDLDDLNQPHSVHACRDHRVFLHHSMGGPRMDQSSPSKSPRAAAAGRRDE